MSEVKRYTLGFKPRDAWYDVPCMEEDDTGSYVLHSDYAAVVAERDALVRELREAYAEVRQMREERDKLAETLSRWGIETPEGYEGSGRKACLACGRWVVLGHDTGCPVALAEKIAKEAGDGR